MDNKTKIIKLAKIEIKNFQAIKEMEIDFTNKNDRKIENLDFRFYENNCIITGGNGVGKSSVRNAILWGVTGGITTESGKNITIKPLDKNQNEIHNLETSVFLTLDVNGNLLKLGKILKEVWKKPPANETLEPKGKIHTGNSIEYYFCQDTETTNIEDCKVTKKAFEQLITEDLTDHNILSWIIDPLGFVCMAWKEQRNVLFSLIDHVSDNDMLSTAPQKFKKLKDQIGKTSIQEKLDMLEKQLRRTKKELSEIEIRINENDTIETPNEAPESELNEIDNTYKQLLEEMAGITPTKEAIKIENDLLQLENKRERIKGAAELKEKIRKNKILDRMDGLSCIRRELLSDKQKITDKLAELNKFIHTSHSRLNNDLRQQWIDGKNKIFIEGQTCKTCRQPLTEDIFNIFKAEQLKLIEHEADLLSADIKNAKKQYEELSPKLKIIEEGRLEVEEFLQWENTQYKQSKIDQQSNSQIKEIAEQIKEKEQLLNNIKAGNEKSDLKKEISEKLKKLDAKRQDWNKRNAIYTTWEAKKNKLSDLQAEQKELVDREGSILEDIGLWKELLKLKIQKIEGKINSFFKTVNFSLFRLVLTSQMVEPCCDLTVEGVPFWQGLNTGKKIEALIDISMSIAKHYNVIVPVIIDNLESCSNLEQLLIHPNTQLIGMEVKRTNK